MPMMLCNVHGTEWGCAVCPHIERAFDTRAVLDIDVVITKQGAVDLCRACVVDVQPSLDECGVAPEEFGEDFQFRCAACISQWAQEKAGIRLEHLVHVAMLRHRALCIAREARAPNLDVAETLSWFTQLATARRATLRATSASEIELRVEGMGAVRVPCPGAEELLRALTTFVLALPPADETHWGEAPETFRVLRHGVWFDLFQATATATATAPLELHGIHPRQRAGEGGAPAVFVPD